MPESNHPSWFFLGLWFCVLTGLLLGLIFNSRHPTLYHTELRLTYDTPAPADWLPFADRYGKNWRSRLIARELHSRWVMRDLAHHPDVQVLLDHESAAPFFETRLNQLIRLAWNHFVRGETLYPKMADGSRDTAADLRRVFAAVQAAVGAEDGAIVLTLRDHNPQLVKTLAGLIADVYQNAQPSLPERRDLSTLTWFASDSHVLSESTTKDFPQGAKLAAGLEQLSAVYEHREAIHQAIVSPHKLLPPSVRSEELETLQGQIILGKMRRDQLRRNSGEDNASIIEINRLIGNGISRFNRLLRPALQNIDTIRDELEDEHFAEHSDALWRRDVDLLKCLIAGPDCHGMLKPQLLNAETGPMLLRTDTHAALLPSIYGATGAAVALLLRLILILFQNRMGLYQPIKRPEHFPQLIAPGNR